MCPAVRRVAVGFEISQETRPKRISAGIDQGPCKMLPEYAIAPVLDLDDLVLNPCQPAFSVIHQSDKPRLLITTAVIDGGASNPGQGLPRGVIAHPIGGRTRSRSCEKRVLVSVAFTMALTGSLAVAGPVRRALRIDPANLLREQ